MPGAGVALLTEELEEERGLADLVCIPRVRRDSAVVAEEGEATPWMELADDAARQESSPPAVPAKARAAERCCERPPARARVQLGEQRSLADIMMIRRHKTGSGAEPEEE